MLNIVLVFGDAELKRYMCMCDTAVFVCRWRLMHFNFSTTKSKQTKRVLSLTHQQHYSGHIYAKEAFLCIFWLFIFILCVIYNSKSFFFLHYLLVTSSFLLGPNANYLHSQYIMLIASVNNFNFNSWSCNNDKWKIMDGWITIRFRGHSVLIGPLPVGRIQQ